MNKMCVFDDSPRRFPAQRRRPSGGFVSEASAFSEIRYGGKRLGAEKGSLSLRSGLPGLPSSQFSVFSRRSSRRPSPKTRKSGRRHFFAPSCARFPGARFLVPYSMTLATTPDATVRPPSRMANRSPCSIAIGVISVISIRMLSPGITISTPSGSLMVPVTSVVRK